MSSRYIQRIKNGDSRAFEDVYNNNKGQFIAFFKKSQGLQQIDAEDIYHKACAVFLNNIETGRLSPDAINDWQVKTYLNNTGKYILFNERRKRQTPLVLNTDKVMYMGDFLPAEDEQDYKEMDDKLFIIRSTVRDMPQPCSQLLRLTVFQKKSHQDVAGIMHYANADTVKTQRHRCMGKLREKVIDRFKLAGYEQ